MNARRAIPAACLAPLAACGPSGTAIDTANPPRTKPGAWVETGTSLGRPLKPFNFCDAGRPILPPEDATCSEWRAVRTADGAIDATAECAKYGATLHMRRRIAGDLASASPTTSPPSWRRRTSRRARSPCATSSAIWAPARRGCGRSNRPPSERSQARWHSGQLSHSV